ncbi:hypothetical protein KY358_03955 [Candidatus Woesearchaeota archaeon]|nr:hypothetical protein [Candidatus Woesearchaeota archaeon]
MKDQEMSALRLIQKVKKESMHIGILFLIVLAAFKVFFTESSILLVSRVVFSIFWLSLVPGFYLMYYFVEKMDFIERLIIGTIFGFAVNSISGYNLGLLGVDVKVQIFLVPITCLIIAGIIIYRKEKGREGKDDQATS